MSRLNVILLSALVTFAVATDVQQCPNASFEDLSNNVQLIPCKKTPCRLKKGTDQHISITFTPERDMADVKNHVTADVFGVALPFLGVDGNSICDKLESVTGEKASCPLVAGTKYVYKDSFPVLRVYPSLNTNVHWALRDGRKDVICFEVPARIS